MKRRSILEVDHIKINSRMKLYLSIGHDYGIKSQVKWADRMG